jgi:hypothetical protein
MESFYIACTSPVNDAGSPIEELIAQTGLPERKDSRMLGWQRRVMAVDEPRPLSILRQYGGKTVWENLDRMRAERGKSLPYWPEWCYVPIAAGIALASGGMPVDRFASLSSEQRFGIAFQGAVYAALGAWRRTKGVYRFSGSLLQELADTPIDQALPSEVLHRLPEWCVYMDLSEGSFPVGGWGRLLGSFAHMEWDVERPHEELRLLLDFERGLFPVPIDLTGSLVDGLLSVYESAKVKMDEKDMVTVARYVSPVVGCVLYLCSEDQDIVGDGLPGPVPGIRTKRGWKEVAAPSVRVWDVGWRVGKMLAEARAREGEGRPVESRSSPRPHVRRAHWHHYWTGPRDGERKLVLRWLHPVLVKANLGDFPAVVHRVEKRDNG